MNYQRDVGQRLSKLLRTITENTSEGGAFTELTYYVKGLRSSILSIFIAKAIGTRNRVRYAQGHLVATTDGNTSLQLDKGRLLITAPANEAYTIDARGHLICVTTTVQ